MIENLAMNLGKKVALIIINEEGLIFAKRLADFFDIELISNGVGTGQFSNIHCFNNIQDGFEYAFKNFKNIVACMASGIVVRMISRFIDSKFVDPAVVVVDNRGRYSISLLSGHEGGANLLAYEVASIIGAEPVVTTATESKKDTILGIGCKKAVKKEDILSAINIAMKEVSVGFESIRHLASCEIKLNEPALWEISNELNVPILFVPVKKINREYLSFRRSLANKYFDIPSVAEASALISSRFGRLILPKVALNGVTVAIVKEEI